MIDTSAGDKNKSKKKTSKEEAFGGDAAKSTLSKNRSSCTATFLVKVN